jgi:DNA-binding transcriptional MerR regulator
VYYTANTPDTLKMDRPTTYTVMDVIKAANIIKAAPLKRRTVQFWSDRGVIRADRETGGSGDYRSFSRTELIIACIIHPLSIGWQGDQTRRISELKDLAKYLRPLIKRPPTCDDFENAIAGNADFYLIVTWEFGGGIVGSIEPIPTKGQIHFPGPMKSLEWQSGRSEVLYLNEWLRPLRDM